MSGHCGIKNKLSPHFHSFSFSPSIHNEIFHQLNKGGIIMLYHGKEGYVGGIGLVRYKNYRYWCIKWISLSGMQEKVDPLVPS